jgi:V/A-type H+/Na+-transporting ATPase subunit F
MSNIALIGEKEIIIGFNLIGLKLFPVTNAEEAIRALNDCDRNDFAIVFITNSISQTIMDKIEEYQKLSSISICILPNRIKDTNLNLNILRKNVEKAVGTDILFRKEG